MSDLSNLTAELAANLGDLEAIAGDEPRPVVAIALRAIAARIATHVGRLQRIDSDEIDQAARAEAIRALVPAAPTDDRGYAIAALLSLNVTKAEITAALAE